MSIIVPKVSIFTKAEESDIKQILTDNQDDNYTILMDKYGSDRIDEGIEAGIFIESILGKKLEFAEISLKNEAKTTKKADENGGSQ